MTIFVSARRLVIVAALSTIAIPATAIGKASTSQDLLSFASGGRILSAPDDTGMSQMDSSPLNLIDDSAATDWTGAAGEVSFVFELSEMTELYRFSFDTGGLNRDAKASKDFVIEVSETSATKGFSEVLGGALKMAKNGQSFSFKPEERPTAQWVRLTLLGNHGDDYQGFTGFHAYGQQLTEEATMPDLTGKYDGASGWGRINLTDGEEGVSGCYEYQQGEFDGVVEGRVLKLSMHQRADGNRLTGLFQLMADGKLVGLVRKDGSAYRDGYADYYSAEKAGGKPNSC